VRHVSRTDRAGAPPAFPSLVGVFSRLSAQQVNDNIKKGNGRMPSFPNIDDARLNALVEYLRSDASPGAGKESAPVPVVGMTAQPPRTKLEPGCMRTVARFAMETTWKGLLHRSHVDWRGGRMTRRRLWK